jgi:hypothetical protein
VVREEEERGGEEREEARAEVPEAVEKGEDYMEEDVGEETEGEEREVAREEGEEMVGEGKEAGTEEAVGTEVVMEVVREEVREEGTEVAATGGEVKMAREGHRENRGVFGRRVVRRIPMDTSSPPGTFRRGGSRSTGCIRAVPQRST